MAFAILMVFLIKGLCDYIANYLINYAGVSAVTDLRNDVFDKVLKQGAQFFEATSTGRLMSSIMNDIEKIQVALSHILADLLRQGFVFLGLLFVVVHKDWKLALVSLTVLPFVLVPTARIGRRIRRTSRRTQDHAAELNQILQETLSGHGVVKAFGAEEFESRRFREAAQRLRRSNLRYVLQQAIASPIIELCGVVTIVGLLTYARTQIVQGQMSSGDFVSFVVALLMMYEPVKRLTGIHNIFEQAIGASQKVFEYLDHTEEIRDKPAAVALRGFERGIRLRGRELPLSGHIQRIRAGRGQPGSEDGRGGGAGGAERGGEDHAGEPGAALLRSDRGGGVDRWPRRERSATGDAAGQNRHRGAGYFPV